MKLSEYATPQTQEAWKKWRKRGDWQDVAEAMQRLAWRLEQANGYLRNLLQRIHTLDQEAISALKAAGFDPGETGREISLAIETALMITGPDKAWEEKADMVISRWHATLTRQSPFVPQLPLL